MTTESTLEHWQAAAQKLLGKRPLASLTRTVDGLTLAPLVTHAPRVVVPPRPLVATEVWAEGSATPGQPEALGADGRWLGDGALAELPHDYAGRLAVDTLDPGPWHARFGPWRHTFFGVAPQHLAAALDEVSGTDGRVFGVDVLAVAEAGGEAPDLLGGFLWRAATGLRAAEAAGADVELLLRHAALRLPLGRDLPANIALIRAARVLWGHFQAAFGVAHHPILIHTVGGVTTAAARDPWNNALRATFEGAAALLGGADAFTLRAYDRLTGASDDGHRLALTTAAVLREEAWLSGFEDAAAGSFALEDATQQLVTAGWARLQTLEGQGEALGALRARREADVARRKLVVVGVNDLAPLDDAPQTLAPVVAGGAFREGASWEALAARGAGLVAVLVPVGDVILAQPRLDFSQRLFAAGGFRVLQRGPDDPEFPGLAAGAVLVLCGADTELVEHGAAVAERVRGLSAALIQAGAPGEAEPRYRAAGVQRFFAAGDDLLTLLSDLVTQLSEVSR